MSFADPQTITIDGASKALVRINQDGYSSEYYLREALGEYTMKIRNSSFTKDGVAVDRHNVEVTQTIYATTTLPAITRKIYFVLENSRNDVPADAVKFALGLAGWMISANLTKIVNRES
jgi:hypothetical protein